MGQLLEVAIALLYRDNCFLMQLRDDLPSIIYPGHWAFFGGHLEPGEDADTAVSRELDEEIGYTPPQLTRYKQINDGRIIRHFYHGPLTVSPDQLQLNEGQDLGLCAIADIQRGYKFSEKLAEDRPLGAPHRAILLDFLATQPLS
ncbi:NUDIX hydrolase [Romeria aff. gracilis LEGE 07310]|uniref:NUDIX hydrolase n=1 Tax=Vasconcelosia minhoensis LEGE 07310 TaxID=915328 RepID=A0A8J7DB96_9CYAN|nr:NUDIX hydrolase [Romeria gracilis]MBE9076073.1 NUDIX hydrolase [Romeria aff. gracilis LEGE 07310]